MHEYKKLMVMVLGLSVIFFIVNSLVFNLRKPPESYVNNLRIPTEFIGCIYASDDNLKGFQQKVSNVAPQYKMYVKSAGSYSVVSINNEWEWKKASRSTKEDQMKQIHQILQDTKKEAGETYFITCNDKEMPYIYKEIGYVVTLNQTTKTYLDWQLF